MIKFWKQYYLDYHASGVWNLNEEELQDESLFWWKQIRIIDVEIVTSNQVGPTSMVLELAVASMIKIITSK